MHLLRCCYPLPEDQERGTIASFSTKSMSSWVSAFLYSTIDSDHFNCLQVACNTDITEHNLEIFKIALRFLLYIREQERHRGFNLFNRALENPSEHLVPVDLGYKVTAAHMYHVLVMLMK